MRRVGILLVTLLLLAGCTTTQGEPAPPAAPPSAEQPPVAEPVVQPQPDPESVVLSRLAMVNAGYGWALGYDVKNSPLLVLRTDSGGESWAVTALPKLPAGPVPGLKVAEILPFGPHRAVLAARAGERAVAVLRTSDGGATWAQTLLEVEPWETGGVHLAFAGEEGWLLLTSDPALGSMRKSIFRSSDGGRSWTSVARAATEKPLPEREYVTGIAAFDGERAWVGRYYRTEESAFLYETADGGKRWSQLSLPYPQDVPHGFWANTFPPLLFGPDRQRGVLVAGFPGIAGATTIYRTSDGGRTWELGTGVTALSLRDYSFADADNGWLLQQGGARLFDTADGGRTWNERIDPNQEFPQLREAVQIEFTDAATGWALLRLESGRSRVLKSTDRGATWTEQPLVLKQPCDCR